MDNLAERGVWHRFLLFEGEGHGFRQANSVRRALLAEVALYRETFGSHIAPDVPLDTDACDPRRRARGARARPKVSRPRIIKSIDQGRS